MKRVAKIILLVTVLLLAVLSIYLYETLPVAIADILPEDNWTKAQITLYQDNHTTEFEFEGTQLEQLLTVLEESVVNRGSSFAGMSPPFLRMHLSETSGPGTLIYVLEDGRMSVAVDYDTDHYRYFQGGEALYQAILQLTAQM